MTVVGRRESAIREIGNGTAAVADVRHVASSAAACASLRRNRCTASTALISWRPGKRAVAVAERNLCRPRRCQTGASALGPRRSESAARNTAAESHHRRDTCAAARRHVRASAAGCSACGGTISLSVLGVFFFFFFATRRHESTNEILYLPPFPSPPDLYFHRLNRSSTTSMLLPFGIGWLRGIRGFGPENSRNQRKPTIVRVRLAVTFLSGTVVVWPHSRRDSAAAGNTREEPEERFSSRTMFEIHDVS